jgi:AraC family transcriptional regulator, transcriptional activator FtrA
VTPPTISLTGRPRLAALNAALPLRLETGLTIEALAREAAMSPRSFIRRFKDATGAPPGDGIAAALVAGARELLKTCRLPLEAVTAAVGLSGAATLRQPFQRRVGLSPDSYRRPFPDQSGTQAPCIAGQT